MKLEISTPSGMREIDNRSRKPQPLIAPGPEESSNQLEIAGISLIAGGDGLTPIRLESGIDGVKRVTALGKGVSNLR